MAHADNIVTDDEVRYMAEAMEDVPFSVEQKAVLRDDISTPQDTIQMFMGVSDSKDQQNFFEYAKKMVMADGEFGEEEQAVMIKLRRIHMRRTNVDDLIGEMDFEIEDAAAEEARSKKDVMFSFREQFLRDQSE